MQCGSNTLAYVVNMFGMLYQPFGKISHAMKLQCLLEKRWNQQEQPIFFLAFRLHPKCTILLQSMACFESKLSLSKMVQYSVLYYKKYIGDLTKQDVSVSVKEVNDWFHDEVPIAQLIRSLAPIQF